MRAPFRPSASRKRRVVGALRAVAGVAASRGSTPAIAAAAPRRRRRVRAIGPAVSCECEIGMMPLRLTRPDRRLDADEAAVADGQMIEPSVSVPTATAPGSPRPPRRSRSSSRRGCGRARTGLRVCPPRPLQPLSRVRRAEVRPLAEVGLAEDDRAGRAQPLDDERVARRRDAGQRERAGGGRHRSAVSMLSLRAPGCRAAGRATFRPCRSASSASASRSASGLSSMTGVERGAGVVDGGDAVEVGLGQRGWNEGFRTASAVAMQRRRSRRSRAGPAPWPPAPVPATWTSTWLQAASRSSVEPCSARWMVVMAGMDAPGMAKPGGLRAGRRLATQ